MNKVFRVDKKRVIYSFLRWQIVMWVGLFLLHDNFQLSVTLKDPQFWWLTVMIILLGLFADFWEIKNGKVVIINGKIIDYSDKKDEIDINEFNAIKKAKTIYGRCLGLEYRIPKGIIERKLFQYHFYSPLTLQKILKEIVNINPQIELDETAQKMLDGTFNYNTS